MKQSHFDGVARMLGKAHSRRDFLRGVIVVAASRVTGSANELFDHASAADPSVVVKNAGADRNFGDKISGASHLNQRLTLWISAYLPYDFGHHEQYLFVNGREQSVIPVFSACRRNETCLLTTRSASDQAANTHLPSPGAPALAHAELVIDLISMRPVHVDSRYGEIVAVTNNGQQRGVPACQYQVKPRRQDWFTLVAADTEELHFSFESHWYVSTTANPVSPTVTCQASLTNILRELTIGSISGTVRVRRDPVESTVEVGFYNTSYTSFLAYDIFGVLGDGQPAHLMTMEADHSRTFSSVVGGDLTTISLPETSVSLEN